MTRRQRAQVVELLRCAADNDQRDGCGLIGMFGTSTQEFDQETHRIAWKALQSFTWPAPLPLTSAYIDEGYRHALLEAAMRVEEGNWP